MERKVYVFEGIVKHFKNVINNCYQNSTTALSPEQALNNICYKYKMSKGLKSNTKITLHGSLHIRGEENYVYRT